LKVGPATDPASQIGPMINARAVEKIERHVRDAWPRVRGRHRWAADVPARGHYYAPTVLVDATPGWSWPARRPSARWCRCSGSRAKRRSCGLANDTPFGLAAYFYSQDPARIWRVAEALETGIVGINEGALAAEAAPFGGVKESGYGREGSRHGLDDYMHVNVPVPRQPCITVPALET
jgi:succinate-semialdehyde dehydrogenase/glutarate-semialdehyde dehydrogenase